MTAVIALGRGCARMVGDLRPFFQPAAAPRASLVKRYGSAVALRLAQGLGPQLESIRPLTPAGVIERRLALVEFPCKAGALAAILDQLMRPVRRQLEVLFTQGNRRRKLRGSRGTPSQFCILAELTIASTS